MRGRKKSAELERAEFVEKIKPFADGIAAENDAARSIRLAEIEVHYAALMDAWRQRVAPSTVMSYVSKLRSALQAELSTGDAAITMEIVRHPEDLSAMVSADYKAKVATEHRELTEVGQWQELIDCARNAIWSDTPVEVAAGLALLTGRRAFEIWCSGSFDYAIDHLDGATRVQRYWVSFKGQAKTRGAEGTMHNQSYRIPVLAPARDIVQRHAWLRRSDLGASLAGADGDTFKRRGVSSRMVHAVTSVYLRWWPPSVGLVPKDLRSLYAELTYCLFCLPQPGVQQSRNSWYSAVLGHHPSQLATSLSYFDWYLKGHREDAERQLRGYEASLLAQTQVADEA